MDIQLERVMKNMTEKRKRNNSNISYYGSVRKRTVEQKIRNEYRMSYRDIWKKGHGRYRLSKW